MKQRQVRSTKEEFQVHNYVKKISACYRLIEKELSTKNLTLIKKYDEKTEDAVEANKNSDNHVLLTVIFSILLFLGGIQKKIKVVSTKFLLIVSMLTFSFATISMFLLPIAPNLLLG